MTSRRSTAAVVGPGAAARLHPRVRAADLADDGRGRRADPGREPTEEDVEPLTWTMYERAREHDSLGYLSAQGRLEAFARA